MAWQNAANMGGNGGSPAIGSEAGNSSGQPQGTEYTLQGVMRFLQTEWHRHERDRNAWQIERAEMKFRIGKLEGDLRTNKKLRESMDKHIRMLENALRKKNNESKASLESSEEKSKDAEGKSSAKPSPKLNSSTDKSSKSIMDSEHDDPAFEGLRHEEERDRSRTYLGKCMEEFAYHVFTSANAQNQFPEEQDAMFQNHQYQNHQFQQHPSLEDVYIQSQQKQHQQQHQRNHTGALEPSPLPNHQPPPVPRIAEVPPLSRGSQSQEQAPPVSRKHLEYGENRDRNQYGPVTAIDRSDKSRNDYGFPNSEDQVERVAHSYNAYGRPVSTRDEDDQARVSEETDSAETDGWNFDDSPEVGSAEDQPAPEFAPPPQRPDTDAFPAANNVSMKSPSRSGFASHRGKNPNSRRRQSDGSHDLRELSTSHGGSISGDLGQFRVRFALRGHLDVVRSVIFTGGGSPSAPELCTAGDDGVIKRWYPASSNNKGDDLDLRCEQTHRGHTGPVLSLSASPNYQPFSNGGRAQGDGWVFSGGEDATVRVWERGRVDPKATLDGHTDAVWCLCVLPGTSGSVLGDASVHHGGPDRTLLVSGAADGTILIWSVSSAPQVSSPHTGSRRGAGGSRRANSVSSGSNFPSSPQPNTATSRPFHHSLVHKIQRADHPAPTCICPLSPTGDTFVVSFADASVLVYSTRTGEEIVGMASLVTYDGTPATGVNTVAATTVGLEGGRGSSEGETYGASGSGSGVEGMVFSGHEDRYIRFFDANSGQCTYDMLAHPAAISALSLSPSGTELVSAGHDASLRFWSLEKRTCTEEISTHRMMRGEGVNCVVWSQDGRWVVSGGGDGVVKVFARTPGDPGGTI